MINKRLNFGLVVESVSWSFILIDKNSIFTSIHTPRLDEEWFENIFHCERSRKELIALVWFGMCAVHISYSRNFFLYSVQSHFCLRFFILSFQIHTCITPVYKYRYSSQKNQYRKNIQVSLSVTISSIPCILRVRRTMVNKSIFIFVIVSLSNITVVDGNPTGTSSCPFPPKLKKYYDYDWRSRNGEWMNDRSRTNYLVLSLSWWENWNFEKD